MQSTIKKKKKEQITVTKEPHLCVVCALSLYPLRSRDKFITHRTTNHGAQTDWVTTGLQLVSVD